MCRPFHVYMKPWSCLSSPLFLFLSLPSLSPLLSVYIVPLPYSHMLSMVKCVLYFEAESVNQCQLGANHSWGPETPDTAPDTFTGTVSGTVMDRVPDRVPDTIADTIIDTIIDTITDIIYSAQRERESFCIVQHCFYCIIVCTEYPLPTGGAVDYTEIIPVHK